MGVKIIVDTQKLVSASEEIVKKADDYKGTADKIFNEIHNMSSSWQGKDNQAYVDQINGFKDDFAKMDKLLRQYAEMLLIVDKEYVKTLESSYAIAKSI